MSSKSLSTGTLSLRFMQNAHRAKQLKEVELDRAEVKDDGMWEVSQAVRDAWGLKRDPDSSSKDVHESSYLPFIFSADGNVGADDNVQKITGRRTFNSKGQEISPSTSVVQVPGTSNASEPSSKRKIHPRPISISASGSSGQLKGFEQLKRARETKTARQTIFESGGVGTDLRTPSFMKPAGIDDPRSSSRQKREGDGSGDEPTKKKPKKRYSDSE